MEEILRTSRVRSTSVPSQLLMLCVVMLVFIVCAITTQYYSARTELLQTQDELRAALKMLAANNLPSRKTIDNQLHTHSPPKIETVRESAVPTKPITDPPLSFEERLELISTQLVNHIRNVLQQGQFDEHAIPVWCVPLFHDYSELVTQLLMIDHPVRQFQFVWNGDNPLVGKVLKILGVFPKDMVVIRHAPENIGFSGAMNEMIRSSMRSLVPQPAWWFLVNADATFPRGSLECFARKVWSVHETHGMLYGPRQDHFAFAITQKAVQTVGFFDEVFYPGYMEDIDYQWRCCLARLPNLITNCNFKHTGSVNQKRRHASSDHYHDMLQRGDYGRIYATTKWGLFGGDDIMKCQPPSGYTRPFNRSDLPLSFWKFSEEHRACLVKGHDAHFTEDGFRCYYNLSRV